MPFSTPRRILAYKNQFIICIKKKIRIIIARGTRASLATLLVGIAVFRDKYYGRVT